MSVNTATGPVSVEALGTTLMHEHVFVMDPAVVRDYGMDWWDDDTRVRDAVAKLNAAKARGIDTIVDVTVLGIGRDVRLLETIARQVDVNLVVSTGLFTFTDVPRRFRNEGPGLALGGEDPLVGAFVGDIRDGIAGTEVRAGMLKTAWETFSLSADALRVHRAAARAQMATGVPVTIHTNSAEQTGRAVVDLYRGEGVDPGRVIVAHAGDSTNVDYLDALVEAGVTLGFDRFGLDDFASTPDRVRTLAELCRRGYADRIILSQDAAAFTESWATPRAQAELARRLPDWHYTFVVDEVLDLLRAAGIRDDQIEQMLVKNPRELLGQPGSATANETRS